MQGFEIKFLCGIKTVSQGAKIVKVSIFFHATGTRSSPGEPFLESPETSRAYFSTVLLIRSVYLIAKFSVASVHLHQRHDDRYLSLFYFKLTVCKREEAFSSHLQCRCPKCSFTYVRESKHSQNSRGAERDPGRASNSESAIKQHAKSTDHNIHPRDNHINYLKRLYCTIRTVGHGCFMAKTDIKNAFRIIPIQPQDYHFLGICWRGLYYYDRCMPMGCSSSCKTFEILSSAVESIAREKLHIDHILHVLDDFLKVSPSHDLCKQQLDLFLMLCQYLGTPMAPEKTTGPSSTISFAGIELDSVLMEARLPPDKLVKCCNLVLSSTQS